MATVSIEEYKKAVSALDKALSIPKDDISRDASIQRFEFCVELAWKTAKKKMGTSTTAPKQVVREMAQNGYIQDVAKWIEAIDHRNLSSHTYDESLANQVYDFATNFLFEFKKLLEKL